MAEAESLKGKIVGGGLTEGTGVVANPDGTGSYVLLKDSDFDYKRWRATAGIFIIEEA